MNYKQQEQIALHRWAVIAEAADGKLTARERGALVRQIAARPHAHPDGSQRAYSRGTMHHWRSGQSWLSSTSFWPQYGTWESKIRSQSAPRIGHPSERKDGNEHCQAP